MTLLAIRPDVSTCEYVDQRPTLARGNTLGPRSNTPTRSRRRGRRIPSSPSSRPLFRMANRVADGRKRCGQAVLERPCRHPLSGVENDDTEATLLLDAVGDGGGAAQHPEHIAAGQDRMCDSLQATSAGKWRGRQPVRASVVAVGRGAGTIPRLA